METRARRTILVPYDFTPLSDCALQHGVQIAKMLHTDLTLLHIIPNLESEVFITEKLTSLANETSRTYKIKPKVMVRPGKVSKAIKNIAHNLKAMLVIMKTDGPKGLQKYFRSRAIKVMMGSEVPFIVVQSPPIRYSIKKVIVPIDFRSENKEKLSWINFLTRFYHPQIYLFRPNISDYRVRNNLKFATKYLEVHNIDFELVHARGKKGFTEESIEFSKFIRADLIIIMLSRFITLDKTLFGLKEQKYITNMHKIPVMVLNPRVDLHKLGGFT
jgi:nucleotide-binding universal stress UspA family protein